MTQKRTSRRRRLLSIGDVSRRRFLRIGGAGLASIPFLGQARAASPVDAITSGQKYRIINVNSGKALDVSSVSTANGANVHQWAYVGGPNQQFTVVEVSPGVYQLIAAHSGKALDVSNASTANGANVHQWAYVGGPNQQWAIESVGNGEFRIVSINSNKVLDVQGGSTSDGGNVQQWADSGEPNQRWRFIPVSGGSGVGGDGSGVSLDGRSWELAWSDEFDGPSLDRNVWTYQNGNGHAYDTPGWGNNELQYYQPQNVWLEDNTLVIEARNETVSDQHGTYPYTSGKIVTAPPDQDQGAGYSFTYGRVDIRARLPTGTGCWPALWMLPDAIYQGTAWPDCGELDIMELVSQEPKTVHGSIHGPDYHAANSVTGAYSLDSNTFAEDFHVFSIVWDATTITWYVDYQEFFTTSRSYVNDVRNSEWVFQKPFHFLFNVAVGGVWPESPDPSVFPQRMEVDYVRVYDG